MEWENNFWDKKTLIDVSKDTNDSGIEGLSYESLQMNVSKTFQIIEKAENIILPKKNSQSRVVTFKSFNVALLLKHISRLEKITSLFICAYSINEFSAILIDEIVKQHNCETQILVSNLRNQAHRKKEELTKNIFIKNKNIKLFFASSHAKIISIKTQNGNHYHIEGSGNLSFNSRIEQMVIDNSEDLFKFTQNWFEKVRFFLKGKKELTEYNFI